MLDSDSVDAVVSDSGGGDFVPTYPFITITVNRNNIHEGADLSFGSGKTLT